MDSTATAHERERGKSCQRRRRIRAATLMHKLVLAAIVAAFTQLLFQHYTGFSPARRGLVLNYPSFELYKPRKTPSQKPHHGVDFSQVWLSSQRLSVGEPVYFPVKKVSRWRRKWSSTYHPFIHWLYQPLGRLAFRDALIAHNLLGIGLLLLCSGLALHAARCLIAFPAVASTILAVLYLTPVGLLHLERGQFDFFIAASVVCVVASFGGRAAWSVLAGLVSTVKVTAWPFVGLYWLLAAPLWGLRTRAVWLLPATLVAINLAFAAQIPDWIPTLRYVAGNTSTHGPSFTRILPGPLPAVLPFASSLAIGLACFAWLHRRGQLGDPTARRALLERLSFPMAAVLVLQCLGGTSVTHDYRLVALLGLLAPLVVWCARGEALAPWLRHAATFGFGAILVVSLRVKPFRLVEFSTVAWVLLLASLAYLALALYLVPARGRSAALPGSVDRAVPASANT